MRNFVTFKSKDFVNAEQEQRETGLFGGQALAESLVTGLSDRGLAVEQPERDDFAWTFYCKINGRNFWMNIGESGDEEDEWLVIANSTLGFLARLLGNTDRREVQQLCQELHEILAADERVSEIRWYTEAEWLNSKAAGAPTPG